MALAPKIRDQAYQQFIQEAVELSQQIGQDLLVLFHAPSSTKIDDLVRAAHSIQSGAAYLGLPSIQNLAQQLEGAFRSLQSNTPNIETELIALLLKAQECLQLSLLDHVQIDRQRLTTTNAESQEVFDQLAARFGSSLQTRTALSIATSDWVLKTTNMLVWLAGSAVFTLPTHTIEEILDYSSCSIQHSGKRRVLQWQKQNLPIYQLADLLTYNRPLKTASHEIFKVPSKKDRTMIMVVFKQAKHVLALELSVDRLVAEPELPIKPFSRLFTPPNYFYGCTLIEANRLVPMIDVAALLQNLGRKKTCELGHKGESTIAHPKIPPIPATTKPEAPTILVVDDSKTLRQILTLTLQEAGYQVLQAGDGQEAIAQLQPPNNVQLVICDIEMPNMDGFEFLRQRRLHPQLTQVPVVMLTFCSGEQDYQLAMQLGATNYFTKPYDEKDFLAALKTIIWRGKKSA
jgi:chemotaxis protein histidine kinase CheA/CheY-like chemotaxis protein